MRRFIIVALALTMTMLSAASAMATNGYQLIGVGQYENSMAGAVTAAPLSAMSAISNPAGMARIGSRADFSMEAFMPIRSVDFTGLGGKSTEGGSPLYGIPAIGWTAPAFNRDDMYFGGGMYGTSGLGVDYEQLTMMPGAALDMMSGAPAGTFQDINFEGYSVIQFWKMAPTVAWNKTENLALGFSLNMDYQSVTIKQRFQNVPFWTNPMDHSQGITQRTINFDLGRPTSQMGLGATLGLLYDINEQFTVGAMYSTKQSFSDAEFRVGTGDVSVFNGAVGAAGTYKMDMDYPQQAALGVAYKPNDKLLIDADVKWINWSDTHDKVKFSGPANSFMVGMDNTGNPIMGSSTELPFGWEDQTVYAIGVQYQYSEKLGLRCGYSYAKSPIDEADVFNNLVFPAIVQSHLGLGFDYRLGDHWAIAMAYQKAFEETLTGTGDVSPQMQQVTVFPADSGAKISLEEDSVGMQLTYRF